MSRRTIILISAFVVTLYFCVLLVILRPMHGNTLYYGNHYLSGYGLRAARLFKCRELRWRAAKSRPVFALVSYPGSGNTWLRYLLQQATGIPTGSIYMDYGLRGNGFPGENVTDGSVLVVKTHELPPVNGNQFQGVVLLIRNPRDAILADFNRLHKGHVGTAPKSAFGSQARPDWPTHVYRQVAKWERLNLAWLRRGGGGIGGGGIGAGGIDGGGIGGGGSGGGGSGGLCVLHYEGLVREPRSALAALLQFLNVTVSQEDLDCTIHHKEGIYRRQNKHRNFDPYTAPMYEALAAARGRLQRAIDFASRLNRTLVIS